MSFDEKALKELVKGKTKEEILGENGLIKSFVKSMVEVALKGELDTHLGYEKYAKEHKEIENSRNGYDCRLNSCKLLGVFISVTSCID